MSKKSKENQKEKEMEMMLEFLQAVNDQRRRKHCEKWDKKLRCEDRCEKLKECKAPATYFRPPKGQTCIWYSVNHDVKNSLTTQLTFQNLPIPKPPCPPLPDITLEDLKNMSEKELRCLFGGEIPDQFKDLLRLLFGGEDDQQGKGKRKGYGDGSDGSEGPEVTFKCPTCPPKPICPGRPEIIPLFPMKKKK